MDNLTLRNGYGRWRHGSASPWLFAATVTTISNTVDMMDTNSRNRLLESDVTRKSVTRRSEGGRWKRAGQPVPRWRPTLLHAGFGGGLAEKQVMLLAACLPYT